MAVKNLYLTGGTLLNGFQPTQEDGTAPADAAFATATGWIVGTVAANNFSGFRANTERATTTFTATVEPATEGLVTGATGNAFRAGPFTGTFAAGDWLFSVILRSVTASMGTGQTGRLRCRLYKSVNADGSAASQLDDGGGYIFTPTGGVSQTQSPAMWTNTVAGNGTVNTNHAARSLTWQAPAVALNNQYIFFVCAYEIIATGGSGATRDANFRENSESVITTPNFVTSSLPIPTDIRTRSLIRR